MELAFLTDPDGIYKEERCKIRHTNGLWASENAVSFPGSGSSAAFHIGTLPCTLLLLSMQ